MITKSGAKNFFVIGTVLCGLSFIGLALLTFRAIPSRTNVVDMDESVIRGKKIWERKNCMGCHTLLGEGGYYAPELTKVTDRRSSVWLNQFLKDPEKMYPGQRKMTNFHFTQEQINDIINFLKWVGKIDTNGFPAEAKKGLGAALSTNTNIKSTSDALQPEKMSLCLGCHQLGGTGGSAGPSFDALQFGSGKLTKEYVQKWLKDPQAIKPDTAMPNLGLGDSDIEEITTFLFNLKNNK
ncbi:MAG: c-type cytochrome [Deltaproteobacteria bacterium]|nr:MAG: c-type cytochrome [Deltaproteobacteria bacterium]